MLRAEDGVSRFAGSSRIGLATSGDGVAFVRRLHGMADSKVGVAEHRP